MNKNILLCSFFLFLISFELTAQNCTDWRKVRCPEGDDWQLHKNAVGKIYENGNANCTGTLLNNTNLDGKGYFLTAHHCYADHIVGQTYVLTIRWNYEHTACSGGVEDTYYEISGSATLRAKSLISDFALFELDPSYSYGDYVPYFAGWDARNIHPGLGAAIHHPGSATKEIAIVNEVNSVLNNGGDCDPWTPNVDGNWWRVGFDPGDLATGSSGSAFFSSGKRVVGQLQGCGDFQCRYKYGKFSTSYTGGTVNAVSTARLDFWLNPDGKDITYLNGYDPNCVSVYLDMICDEFAVCRLYAQTPSNAANPLSYNWTINSNPIFGANNSSSIVICGTAQQYSVTVTDNNGCSDTYTATFDPLLACYGTPRENSDDNNNYHNSYILVNGNTFIRFPFIENSISFNAAIYDISGSLKWQQKVLNYTESISVDIEQTGIYILVFKDEHNKIVHTQKLSIINVN